MKKHLVLVAALSLSAALGSAAAADFVFPAKWSVDPPSAVKTGGVLRLASRINALSFNPFLPTSGGADVFSTLQPGAYLYSKGLVFSDPGNVNDHIPYMAESYTVSQDKRVFMFKIRQNMKWSDGKPITADDWLMTYKIHIDENVGSPSIAAFVQEDGKITKVEKIDTYTLRFTFPKASHDNWDIVAFAPFPAHIFGAAYTAKGAAGVKALWNIDTPAKDIVTAGPWKLVSFQPNERYIFEANPYFREWNTDSAGKPVPYLSGLQVSIVKDTNSEFVQFLNGSLDQFTPRNTDDLAQIKKAIDAGNIKAVLKPNYGSPDSSGSLLFNFNRASDPEKQRLFRNADFRRAMSHLVDRKGMIDLAWGGLAQAQWTHMASILGEWVSPSAKRFEYNPEAAKALLAKVGYSKKNSDGYLVNKDGRVLEFDITTQATGSITLKMVQIFAEDAKKAGVKVNIKPIETAQYGPLLRSTGTDRKFDAIFFSVRSQPHPWPMFANLEECDIPGNLFHYYNNSGTCLFPWETQVSALYKRGESEFDNAKRIAIAHQMQNILAEQQVYVPFPAPTRSIVWTNRVQGEYPADRITGGFGTRNLMLTWVSGN